MSTVASGPPRYERSTKSPALCPPPGSGPAHTDAPKAPSADESQTNPNTREPSKGYNVYTKPGAVVCSGAVPWGVRLEGRTFPEVFLCHVKTGAHTGWAPALLLPPHHHPCLPQPTLCVAIQKANPSEDRSGPGSVEKLPTAAEVLGCCLLKGSVSRSGWRKQRFQGALQGVAEQGLGRTT